MSCDWQYTAQQCAENRRRINLHTELASPRKTAVVLTCSRAFTFCTYVSVDSFLRYSPQLAEQSDIFVFIWQADDKLRQIFTSLSDRVQVVDFDMPYPVPARKSITLFTPASYARFECFRLLDRYERVLFLDSDVLVRKELAGVFDQISNGIGITLDPVMTTVTRNFFSVPEGVNPSSPGYNAGVFALTRKLPCPGRYAEITDWLYAQMARWADYLFLPDQAVINVAVDHFGWQATVLPRDYNRPASSSHADLKRAYIVHSTGPRKFWCYYYFREWYRGYAEWIKKGGAPVSVRKDSRAYVAFCRKFGLQNRVFFQLMPDCFARPVKALRFALKAWLKPEF